MHEGEGECVGLSACLPACLPLCLPCQALMRHRLDQMAVAGLPLWITELDFSYASLIYNVTNQQRADFLETATREAFAHPAVQGIMYWQAGQAACSVQRDMQFGPCSPCVGCFADDNFIDNEVGKR